MTRKRYESGEEIKTSNKKTTIECECIQKRRKRERNKGKEKGMEQKIQW